MGLSTSYTAILSCTLALTSADTRTTCLFQRPYLTLLGNYPETVDEQMTERMRA